MQLGREVDRVDYKSQCYALQGKNEAEVSNTLIRRTILLCDRMANM